MNPARVRRRREPSPLEQIPAWRELVPVMDPALTTEPSPGLEALLGGLNPDQLRAVTHGDGPLLVVAGAGTGKTQVITRRIAWLIATRRAKPSEILALTFTDKAAEEMAVRVDQLVPYGYTDTAISTFHAFGDRLIRDHALELGLPTDVRVLSRAEVVIFMREHLFEFELDAYRPLGDPTRFLAALATLFSRCKDEDISPAEYHAHADRVAAEAQRVGDAAAAATDEVSNVARDAALYWLAAMIAAGEDPKFIARRLIISASEDVGNADPRALQVAVAAGQALDWIGLPEAQYALAQATTYIATAPKSNRSGSAYWAAVSDVEASGALPVPLHLRNAAHRGMKQHGIGVGYRYAHDYEGADIEQQYLPDAIVARRYYLPTDQGYEATIAARMAARADARAAARAVGRTPRTSFPAPEVKPHSGDGLMKTREANRRKLAETEKRDASDDG